MAEYALPCVVCNIPLRNVFNDIDNQPNGGVCFTTHGNYGSEIFDPADGQHLEISICDNCLVRLGEEDKVFTGRFRRPVCIDVGKKVPLLVGWERIDRPYIHWRSGMESDEYAGNQLIISDVEEFNRLWDLRDHAGRNRFDWGMEKSQIQHLLTEDLDDA